jgi:hypothetical protein
MFLNSLGILIGITFKLDLPSTSGLAPAVIGNGPNAAFLSGRFLSPSHNFCEILVDINEKNLRMSNKYFQQLWTHSGKCFNNFLKLTMIFEVFVIFRYFENCIVCPSR